MSAKKRLRIILLKPLEYLFIRAGRYRYLTEIFQFVYLTVAHVVALAIKIECGADSVLCRKNSRLKWLPGVSDIDFTVIWKTAHDHEMPALQKKLERCLGKTKSFFPIVGEALAFNGKGYDKFSMGCLHPDSTLRTHILLAGRDIKRDTETLVPKTLAKDHLFFVTVNRIMDSVFPKYIACKVGDSENDLARASRMLDQATVRLSVYVPEFDLCDQQLLNIDQKLVRMVRILHSACTKMNRPRYDEVSQVKRPQSFTAIDEETTEYGQKIFARGSVYNAKDYLALLFAPDCNDTCLIRAIETEISLLTEINVKKILNGQLLMFACERTSWDYILRYFPFMDVQESQAASETEISRFAGRLNDLLHCEKSSVPRALNSKQKQDLLASQIENCHRMIRHADR